MREKFPELGDFADELSLSEKASGVGLESVLGDVGELEKGWGLAEKEAALRGEEAAVALTTFIAAKAERMAAIREKAKLAQEAYKSCLEWFAHFFIRFLYELQIAGIGRYGETGRSLDSAAFFSLLFNFARRFKEAQRDNLEKKKAEQVMHTLQL